MRRAIVLLLGVLALTSGRALADAGWPYYGGDEGGTRYSPAAEITPKNVDDLIPVWTYHTGDMTRRDLATMRQNFLSRCRIFRCRVRHSGYSPQHR